MSRADSLTGIENVACAPSTNGQIAMDPASPWSPTESQVACSPANEQPHTTVRDVSVSWRRTPVAAGSHRARRGYSIAREAILPTHRSGGGGAERFCREGFAAVVNPPTRDRTTRVERSASDVICAVISEGFGEVFGEGAVDGRGGEETDVGAQVVAALLALTARPIRNTWFQCYPFTTRSRSTPGPTATMRPPAS